MKNLENTIQSVISDGYALISNSEHDPIWKLYSKNGPNNVIYSIRIYADGVIHAWKGKFKEHGPINDDKCLSSIEIGDLFED